METHRIVLALVLSLTVLFVWEWVILPWQQQQMQQPAAVEAPPKPAAPQQAAAADDVDQQTAFVPSSGKRILVATPLYTAEFDSAGGVLVNFLLNRFKTGIDMGSPDVDLIGSQARERAPLGLLLGGQGTWRGSDWQVQGGDLTLKEGEEGALILTGQAQGMQIVRELRFDAGNYLIKEKVRIHNPGKNRIDTRLGFSLSTEAFAANESTYNKSRVAWSIDKKLHEEADTGDLGKGMLVESAVDWGGIQSNYFLAAVVPDVPDMLLRAKFEDSVYRVALEKRDVALDPGADAEFSCTYYLGPKAPDQLAAGPKSLGNALSYGWFSFIAKPLLKLLQFFHGYVGNYGVAIILLTILIKIVFWPLSYKSYKSMEAMKRLQPMMVKIREKYKDDRQRMNQEIMGLYKTYKVSPAGGCLPMLVQIPVFIGLYQALLNAIELRHAAFIAHLPFTKIVWLADLSAKDPYYITPLIMGASMFLQQKMTPPPGDPTQAKIMMFMPIMFTFLFLNFPSGLVVYWLVNNILSIVQQGLMLRKK